ncbi:phosphatidylinositol N-acetylglucosaminyltransferase subunit Y [Marchantia polymorpha subsp. ruderalis]|uniref:Phosphatidylinositol N-acetylglucosaminyltransferase subunit Y n=2 Tax=Marchantia polymorpha TaxID=3197 RepID=A0A176WHD1_MARPO|nr:hypothetical protein AXG93_4874s1050 [Marchantia polymorpha subsp. ruderalis]PTQ38949.1 hypothetical protein MARPO_0048s0062 [Marchantia polymorpha]BBN11221.1 hypothetical protein Mp_5g10100 [Marchantia polymorpha subsp. ruderalis]|eukprot:PTQ38949.1 hypothetical protein MARPO_0048s0062 [Marchantia polymorpha]
MDGVKEEELNELLSGALIRVPSLRAPRRPDPAPAHLGVMLIIAGIASVALCIYTLATAKILPPARNPSVDMMRSDWYYCLLLPLTLPVTLVAIYLHWLSMKLFKHA